jgi:hypothetical protein
VGLRPRSRAPNRGHGEGKTQALQARFFSAAEYATVARLCDLIIPSDETPGAREAGASEFIDFMVGHQSPDQQKRFRTGLAWLEDRAQGTHKRAFTALAPPAQQEILDALAFKDRHRPGDEAGRAFFSLVREYTVMGYYTSEMGLQELDYPGFKFYGESPKCPHDGNPAHQHLPPAPARATAKKAVR